MKKTTTTTLLALATVAALATGCTDSPAPRGDSARSSIDARAYYEDYAEEPEGDGAGAVPMATAAPGAATDTEVEVDVPEVPRVPRVDEDNTFVGAGLHDFVPTSKDARSTFALDVDTGSFMVARTLLDQDVTPPPASIRVEEWVNAQQYDYAAPQQDLGVDVGHGTVAGDDRLDLLRLGVQARDVSDDDRAPVNVTLVVDVSGSMDIRDRLGLVKSSVALLAKHLKPTDTVSLVTYESTAEPLLRPTPIRDTDTILDAIDELRPGGSTNLEAGLRSGYRLARKTYRDGAVNAVVLCSDGVANVGTTGPSSLAETIQQGRNDGIHLVTVGFGMGNYNDHLMEQLADQGDGFYRYVDTFDEARNVFVRDLTGTLTPVADDAKTQVTFDPAAVDAYRLIGYDNRAIADDEFTNPAVDAGEIGAGQSATALYELKLADGVRPGQQIGTMQLRWVDRDGQAHRTTTPLTAADPGAQPDDATELASVTADLAQVLKRGTAVRSRDISLSDVRQRAQTLADRGVEGADQLVELADQAEDNR